MQSNALREYKDKYGRLKPKANKILDKAEAELYALLKKYNVHLSYRLEGDTDGIYNDYQYISVTPEGVEFQRKLN